MENYKELILKCFKEGEYRQNRTGINTISLFAENLQFNLDPFPLLDLRKISMDVVADELLFFLSGKTNTSFLKKKIWDPWAGKNGELGPIYGKQWRDWDGIDQVQLIIEEIKNNPQSRRLLVSAWNVSDLDKMALPPCHYSFQFFVTSKKKLNILVNMRSADLIVGLPFNIASYALLTYFIGFITNLAPGVITINMGDCHIYENLIDVACVLLDRNQRSQPTLAIQEASLDPLILKYNINGYSPYSAIKCDVAV
jgi:thymidylate synthase